MAPSTPSLSGQPPQNCRICLGEPTCPTTTPCRHTFCYECITTHLLTRSTCPICSTYLTVQTLQSDPAPSTPRLYGANTPSTPAPALAGDAANAATSTVTNLAAQQQEQEEQLHTPTPTSSSSPAAANTNSHPNPNLGELTPEITTSMSSRRAAPPPLLRTRQYAQPSSPSTQVVRRMRAEALYNATVGQQSPSHMLSNNNNSSQPLHHHHHSSLLANGLRRSNPSFNASHPSTNPFPAATVSVLADSSDSGSASARPSLKQPRSTTAAESQLLSSRPAQSNGTMRDEQEQQQHQQHSQAQSQVQQLTGLSPSLLRSGPNADALLAATDGLTAEQLAGVIAQLSQKLQKKERSDRYIENHLLLHFLQHLRRQKEALLRSLCAKLEVLSADIRVTEAQCALQQQRGSHLPRTLSVGGVDDHAISRDVAIDPAREDHGLPRKRQRVIDNFSVLEDHYFSTVGQQAGDSRKKALKYFTDDVFKLTQYSRLRHCATLMHVARVPDAPGGDVFRASNIVSSMEFDRDSEFLATAGVSRKIKIFEFSNVVRNLTDVHYPIREIPTQDKLSWVCWNPYIRHHLLSSDYEGLVKIWDVNLATALSEYEEHECRAWSVDYCPTKPAYFASGSDDGTVKIWTTTQRNSVMTIDNERANVCSVKFHPSASELLAFGSVDHSVKYYDLRNPSHPLQTFKSHSRAVSYVKFMSNDELVSASVDSTVKMWNLRDMSLTRTFKGHANNKNFVGLSVTPDYIACGSEENSVFCYYKAVPPPLTAFRFSTIDPLTGDETTEEDEMQFVSSVCWCPKDPTLLVAANSLGAMKVLKLQPEEEDEDSEAARDGRNSNADREDLVVH